MRLKKYTWGYRRACPFVDLPRRVQREIYIRLRWKIRRDTPQYGGRFTSHLVLDDFRPDLFNQDFDFDFLGRKRFTVWHASIITARKAFWDAVSNIALDRAFSMPTREEQEKDKFKFIPIYHDGKKYFKFDIECYKYDKFGGLTLDVYCDKLQEEISRTEPPVIFETFRVIPESRYGAGLSMVVDAEHIDRTVIEQAIDHFYKIGEKDWQAAEPVQREKLPYESEREALAKVNYPSVLFGQAIRKGAWYGKAK